MSSTSQYELLGFTPLHVAVATKRLDDARRLLESGADVDAVTKDGHSAFMLAVRHRFVDAAMLLLERGSDPTLPDARGRTPWEEAKRSGDRKILEFLVAAGASQGEAVSNLYFQMCPEALAAAAETRLDRNAVMYRCLDPVMTFVWADEQIIPACRHARCEKSRWMLFVVRMAIGEKGRFHVGTGSSGLPPEGPCLTGPGLHD